MADGATVPGQRLITALCTLVMGDILERLDDGEERVVFAHEMAHLVNRDIWPMLLLRAGSGGLAWQKWGLLIAMIVMGYEWIGRTLSSLQLTFPREVAFLVVAWVITAAVHSIYKLGEMAHSRGREYLADVGAVALTGWENRARLITALLKIGHGQTGRSPFGLLRRTGYEIFMPHPAIVDRAAALEVPVPQIPNQPSRRVRWLERDRAATRRRSLRRAHIWRRRFGIHSTPPRTI